MTSSAARKIGGPVADNFPEPPAEPTTGSRPGSIMNQRVRNEQHPEFYVREAGSLLWYVAYGCNVLPAVKKV